MPRGLLHGPMGVAMLLAASACARPPQAARAPVDAALDGAAAESEVPVIVTTEEATLVQDLLLRAERRLELGQLELAVQDFELLLAAGHAPPLEARIRLGYALALESRGDLQAAVEQLALRIPLVAAGQVDAARLELVRRLLLLERFAAARARGQEVDRAAAPVEDRVLLWATDALALVTLGDVDRADAVLVPAWSALEVAAETGKPVANLPAAWVAFAAGEAAALRAHRIAFDPVPDNVPASLEQRCQHMVTAQSAYAEAMRLERGRVRLLAGARIAELYRDLHADILRAPLPAGFAAGDARELAEGAILLRYRVLLEKAEQMLRITLSAAPPSRATAALRLELEAKLADVSEERTAQARKLEALPVAPSELERVLATLGPAFESAPAAAAPLP